MIEFIIGLIVGGAAVIHSVRRYRNRDGKLADLVRRTTGATSRICSKN